VEDAQAEAEQELALEAKATEPATERASWLILAERGDFAAAFSELDQGGTFQAVLQASSAEELMTLADVARFAGRDGRAIMALRQVTERYRDDPNAPLAAMMLGNLLSRAGDREGARAAYALNRTLSPDGDFAEDALVRELERAEKLLQKYETEFPSGSRLAAVRAEVEVLRAELDNEQADEGAESTQDEPLEAPAPATEDGGQEDGEADQREEAPGQRPAHQSAQPSPDSPLVDDGAASPPGPRDPVDGLD
jgi:tetratricopeptide (TPR) repeat protein